MSFESCLKRKLIKKNLDSKDRIEKELISAKRFLASAKNILSINELDLSFISSYNSCFHFLRALLFSKGYTEKSHYCLIQALKSLYSTNKKLLPLLTNFDRLRQARHEIQYGGIFSNKEEVDFIIKLNEQLKKETEEILAD